MVETFLKKAKSGFDSGNWTKAPRVLEIIVLSLIEDDQSLEAAGSCEFDIVSGDKEKGFVAPRCRFTGDTEVGVNITVRTRRKDDRSDG